MISRRKSRGRSKSRRLMRRGLRRPAVQKSAFLKLIIIVFYQLCLLSHKHSTCQHAAVTIILDIKWDSSRYRLQYQSIRRISGLGLNATLLKVWLSKMYSSFFFFCSLKGWLHFWSAVDSVSATSSEKKTDVYEYNQTDVSLTIYY